MLPSACGLGQHFQDLGHSFSPYGPPSRQITYIYWRAATRITHGKNLTTSRWKDKKWQALDCLNYSLRRQNVEDCSSGSRKLVIFFIVFKFLPKNIKILPGNGATSGAIASLEKRNGCIFFLVFAGVGKVVGKSSSEVSRRLNRCFGTVLC